MTERPRRTNAGCKMQQALMDFDSSEEEEIEEPLLFDPGPEIDPVEEAILSDSEDEASDEPIPLFEPENVIREEIEYQEFVHDQMDIDYLGNGIYGDENLPHENERLFFNFDAPVRVPEVSNTMIIYFRWTNLLKHNLNKSEPVILFNFSLYISISFYQQNSISKTFTFSIARVRIPLMFSK